MTIPAYSVVQGVVVGMQFGLLAMGLVLVYRSTRVLNFAQGQLGVLGAVLLAHLATDLNVPYAAALGAALVVAALTGAGCELLLRRLANRPRLLVMVATIGLAQLLFLLSLLPFVRQEHAYSVFPLPLHLHFSVGVYQVAPGEVLTLIVGPLIAIGVTAFIAFSNTGLRIRASSENPESARLAGVPVKRMSTVVWVLAALLSAAAAILNAPSQGNALGQALGPDLLLRALAAALIAGMSSMTVAFVAGIGIGIFQQVLLANVTTPATVNMAMFGLILVALIVQVSWLRRGAVDEDRSSWQLAVAPAASSYDPLRRLVGRSGIAVALGVALVLPLFLGIGNQLLIGRIAVFALIAVSLNLLAGWSGQLSLGHVALAAFGAVVFARLGGDVSLPLLFLIAGVVGAAVAVVIGIPALRIPGLYLAVTTLGLALVVEQAVLRTPCPHLPIVGKACTGLPDPGSTLTTRPSLFGIGLSSNRAAYYVALGVLLLAVSASVAWRDHGLARLLLAVRGNERAAAAMGVRPVRAKLTAFAVSGFLAGTAGVCYGMVLQRYGADDFVSSESLRVVAMVVIGGLGSISGAVLGAVFLVGLPALFGSGQTVQFLTSGIGLLVFLLYFPGGLRSLTNAAADAATTAIRRVTRRPAVEKAPVGAGPATSEAAQVRP
jgi:ABC-type branched-subunit amino acid transport system permease subunit